MIACDKKDIEQEYFLFLKNKEFPCISAKAALSKQQIKCMVAGNMMCPKDDSAIVNFLYNFIDEYKSSGTFYHSAVIIFTDPINISEELFDELLWKRLQAIADIDATKYAYDKRVSNKPSSEDFSFSAKEEAFYVIGLHPASSRLSRRFNYPALVFNPHAQFEALKETGKYEMIKKAIRKRDIIYSGSINPMLADFGTSSEAYQYSGRVYDETWQCPLKINHAEN